MIPDHNKRSVINLVDTAPADVHNHVRLCVISVLLDSDDGSFLSIDAETNFGSHGFDNHFSHIGTQHLLNFILDHAADNEEGHGPLKDFIGTIDEYVSMPCASLLQRMIQASRRAVQ